MNLNVSDINYHRVYKAQNIDELISFHYQLSKYVFDYH